VFSLAGSTHFRGARPLRNRTSSFSSQQIDK
jgi:hypothetical protein